MIYLDIMFSMERKYGYIGHMHTKYDETNSTRERLARFYFGRCGRGRLASATLRDYVRFSSPYVPDFNPV